MRNIGSALLFFGIGSAVLYFIGYEFIILSWIENWGESVAWIIRAAMIIAGGGLFFIGGNTEGGKGDQPQPEVNEPADGDTVSAD